MTSVYPKIVIQYCSKCKWQNRAFWYLQEILQSFEEVILDVSLQPVFDKPGTFAIILYNNSSDFKIIYKRKFKNPDLAVKFGEDQLQPYFYDGFPDAKFVKLLIKQNLDKDVSIGAHVVRSSTDMLTNECTDCKLEDK